MISRKLARVNSRLERLEENYRHHRANIMEQIQKAALQDLSVEDLEVMKTFVERGAPFSDPTPEESATLARYPAAGDAAALRIIGRPLAKRRGYLQEAVTGMKLPIMERFLSGVLTSKARRGRKDRS